MKIGQRGLSTAAIVGIVVAVVVVVAVAASAVILLKLGEGGATTTGTPTGTPTTTTTTPTPTTTTTIPTTTTAPTTTSTTTTTGTSTTTGTTTTENASEYVIKEYLAGIYSGTKSPLVFGEINYTIRHDYDLSNYTPPFRIRLWDNGEGVTYNTGTVTTMYNYEYAEWNFGTGEAYVSKSGVQRAALYDDSNGSFVDENFGWLGSRWCQGRLFIDTENEVIKNIAADICSESDSPYEVAKNVALWMLERLNYAGGTVPFSKTPPEVLDSGEGECGELSMLYVSLCRAAGVPARLVYGDYFSKTDEIGGHVWAEFYDSGKWIPVDITLLLRYHTGPMEFDFGPASDWFGFVDARDVPRYVEDASENSMERVFSDAYHFDTMFGLQLGAIHTRSGSMSIQESAKILIYNTGRRELVFVSSPT